MDEGGEKLPKIGKPCQDGRAFALFEDMGRMW